MNLEVGTAETIIEKEKKLKRRLNVGSGRGSNGSGKNGGGGGGGNGGDDNSNSSKFEQIENPLAPDKFRIGMWFLMLIVIMTFGGLIGAYIVISSNGVAEWTPFNLPFQVWVSTILILTSSVTYQISNSQIKKANQQSAKIWLLATTALGAAFISSQILAWFELVRRGVYVASNPYAGFFYILTAVHALHVIGGISALGYIVLRSWYPTASDDELYRRQNISNIISWYWHLMDGLWIVLFLLLGFWK